MMKSKISTKLGLYLGIIKSIVCNSLHRPVFRKVNRTETERDRETPYRWKDQVKMEREKNKGVNWIEVEEQEIWVDRDRWKLLSETRPSSGGCEDI